MTPIEVVSSFVAVARPIILQFMNANSCIASSRIAIECMKHFGVEAHSVPVKLAVQFPAKGLVYCSGLSKEEKTEAEKHATNFVDMLNVKDGWNGHVIVVTQADEDYPAVRYLLDPSFDQASASGVELPPTVLAIPIEGDIPDNVLHANLSFNLDDGQLMHVEYVPLDDKSYLTTPAWDFDIVMQCIVNAICLRMESLMEGGYGPDQGAAVTA